jgi:hypothetical protein
MPQRSSLYESLGFIREKRLFRFYLNGKDAFRLVLEMPVSDETTTSSKATSQTARPNSPFPSTLSRYTNISLFRRR